MSSYVSIRIGKKLLARKVKVCDTLFSRTLGLMFSPSLPSSQGILLVANQQSKAQTSIHSFFVFFTFDALWVDENKRVVDRKTVKPFQALIRPREAAKYVIELPRGSTEGISLGSKIEF
ncbi:hypothetical protein EXS74_00945 [Candidatus Woesearchaeota archaeon]|nr:hypothetical protein [Candidatus Woesearchaeota archaeon]